VKDINRIQNPENEAWANATPSRVVVLGGGPAGLGAAYQLLRRTSAEVTLLEQRDCVGGNAGSFEFGGFHLDYGSHRLHPACDPEILHDIRELLGEDLLDRPRHGRILLEGRWIHFPLKPLDLLLRLPRSFTWGVGGDVMRKMMRHGQNGSATFASVLEHSLGRTICQKFYFPYARKLWGIEPEELAVTQARRRVSNNSLGKMFRKVASAIPGLKPRGAGRFYYPRRGYGEISQRMCEAAQARGAQVLLGSRVTAVQRDGDQISGVQFERNGREDTIRTRNVWSTLPITALVRAIQPSAPSRVLEAASRVCFRGMILIYVILEQDQFTEYDAHYFPQTSIPISRLSEPKNYSASREPLGRTVLCAELPSDPGSREWQMSDEELGGALREWLSQAGLPVHAPVRHVMTRRLRQAYPVYRRGYDEHIATMDDWLSGIKGLVTFGRQGLFAHDNTHHALYMAYSAVDCYGRDGHFDRERWRSYREIFETHVVED
jgi:protoporphyrinogen oxidase